MPLYEIHGTGDLIPFRRLQGESVYEREIEDLLWANPEEFTGEALFLVARQPTLPSGGRPDIVALDKDARVVIVEIKRDIDRRQLAQCLEYAGWGRSTNLDELSSLYQRQPERDFFGDWQEFTGGTLTVINPSPRLVLVARDFHGRTGAALEFLMDGRLPLAVVKVSIYEDEQERRFLDIEGEREPELVPADDDGSRDTPDHTRIGGRRVRMSDLVEAGLIEPGDELVWDRPRLGVTYRASVVGSGAIVLTDGRQFASPSRAAVEAAEIPACDGWYVWRLPRLGGTVLNELRGQLARDQARAEQVENAEEEA
jgi:hypothetical protein